MHPTTRAFDETTLQRLPQNLTHLAFRKPLNINAFRGIIAPTCLRFYAKPFKRRAKYVFFLCDVPQGFVKRSVFVRRRAIDEQLCGLKGTCPDGGTKRAPVEVSVFEVDPTIKP